MSSGTADLVCKLRRGQSIWILAIVLIVLTAGCRDNGGLVTGTVTYRGKPVNGAIYFYPTSGAPVITAVDEQGKYSINVKPGEYRVIVNQKVPLPPGWKEGDPLPPPTETLPAEYTEPANTVLAATVSEGQSEPINFDLK
jgi:hypothetical protein